jgi:hypothetical protein
MSRLVASGMRPGGAHSSPSTALCRAALALNRTLAQQSRSCSLESSPQEQRAANQRRSARSSHSATLPIATSRLGSAGAGGCYGIFTVCLRLPWDA